jgi:hypothetical protein
MLMTIDHGDIMLLAKGVTEVESGRMARKTGTNNYNLCHSRLLFPLSCFG